MPIDACNSDEFTPSEGEWSEVVEHLSLMSIFLGVFLIVGGIVSVMMQHLAFSRKKSVKGVSDVWLFNVTLGQLFSVGNVVFLKYRQFQACEFVGFACVPSLLSAIQLITMSVSCLSLLPHFWYLAPSSYPSNVVRRSRGLFTTVFVAGVVLASIALIISASNEDGVCSDPFRGYGGVLGIMAAITTIVQLSPQIYTTFRSKSVGSFSIPMIMMQAPGTFLLLGFMIWGTGEAFTTWASTLLTGIQQMILLALLVRYRAKEVSEKKLRSQPASSKMPSDDTPLLKDATRGDEVESSL